MVHQTTQDPQIQFQPSPILKQQTVAPDAKTCFFKPIYYEKATTQINLKNRIRILAHSCFWYYKAMLQVSETHLHRAQLALDSASITLGYTKVNAYSHKPAVEQILAMAIFVTIVALHAVFITTNAATLQSPYLWTIVAVSYGLLVLMAYDYVFITCNDPVDDLVLKVQKNYKQHQIIDCYQCRTRVHQKSHHCQSCQRCVQHFDHHCKYLNNCIGGKNYPQFIRLLLTVTFFCIGIICSGAWVFVVAERDGTYGVSRVGQWGALITAIVALVAMVSVESLLFFHIYLICWVKMSTLEYIKKGWEQQQRKEEQKRKGQQQ